MIIWTIVSTAVALVFGAILMWIVLELVAALFLCIMVIFMGVIKFIKATWKEA